MDNETRHNSAPQSPATTPRPYTHNDAFSPHGYTEPIGSPGYFSPLSQTSQRSPAYQPSEVQSPYSNPYTSPSDFSTPSLLEFLDIPGASFPNLAGEDLTNSGYVTAAGHAAAHHHMQFEPQMDGTFDPTSITDQSLDGSAGSNPTTPEKNKSTISPATSPQVTDKPEIVKKPMVPLKKYCEICGKEYEGKNKSMNKV